jgi:hypothetical protein
MESALGAARDRAELLGMGGEAAPLLGVQVGAGRGDHDAGVQSATCGANRARVDGGAAGQQQAV